MIFLYSIYKCNNSYIRNRHFQAQGLPGGICKLLKANGLSLPRHQSKSLYIVLSKSKLLKSTKYSKKYHSYKKEERRHLISSQQYN